MPAVMTQHQNAHLISDYSEEEVVAKHANPSSTKIIAKEPKLRWIRGDSILGCLDLGEESTA